MRIPDKIATKAKAVVAGIGSLATAGSEALADNVIEMSEVGTLVTVAGTAVVAIIGVFAVPNRPERAAKVRR